MTSRARPTPACTPRRGRLTSEMSTPSSPTAGTTRRRPSGRCWLRGAQRGRSHYYGSTRPASISSESTSRSRRCPCTTQGARTSSSSWAPPIRGGCGADRLSRHTTRPHALARPPPPRSQVRYGAVHLPADVGIARARRAPRCRARRCATSSASTPRQRSATRLRTERGCSASSRRLRNVRRVQRRGAAHHRGGDGRADGAGDGSSAGGGGAAGHLPPAVIGITLLSVDPASPLPNSIHADLRGFRRDESSRRSVKRAGRPWAVRHPAAMDMRGHPHYSCPTHS